MRSASIHSRPIRRSVPRSGELFALVAFLPFCFASSSRADLLEVEKDEVTLGFIKLTDCAPLVIAKEKGFFDDEGVFVNLEAQANWKILLDRVIGGELDGAHMLAGQPIGASIGIGTKADVIAAVSLDLNGNAITVSNEVWALMKAQMAKGEAAKTDKAAAKGKPAHPIKADSLKAVAEKFEAEGKPLKFGMVFPVSTHNYELRYWLAAGGLHPGFYTAADVTGTTDADVLLSVTPPPQMPATLEQGTIHGYCVGEPWNQQAVVRGIGVPVVTDEQIWARNPEKVFGVTAAWDAKYPNTHLALLKAIVRACKWLDESPENRREAVRVLSDRAYVGADEWILEASMTGTFEFEKGDVRPMPDFNVFFRHDASYPFYSDCIWTLTQMRRWGQIAEPKPDAWYHETARKVYRPDLYKKAAAELVKEGRLAASDIPKTDGYKAPDCRFIDGKTFDGRKPVAYLGQFEIGHKE